MQQAGWYRNALIAFLCASLWGAAGCGSDGGSGNGNNTVGAGSSASGAGGDGTGGTSSAGGHGGQGNTGGASATSSASGDPAGTGGGSSTGGGSGTGGEGVGGGTSCTDQCIPNTTECSNTQIQLCALQANGCYDWGAAQSCPTFQTCSGGQCVLSCTDQCDPQTAQCSGSKIQNCTLQANGCYDWNPGQNCPTFQTCAGGQCVLACTDKCDPSTAQCSNQQVQACQLQVNGCYDWGAPQNCPTFQTCSGGECVLACSNQCAAGDQKCSGSQIQTCELQANGCLDWSPSEECGGSQTCLNDECYSPCVNKCAAGQTQCFGTKVQACSLQANGCYDWGSAQNCAVNQICSVNQCVSATCTKNELRCNGSQLEVCNSSNQWQTQQICSQSCDPQTKSCTGASACAASSRRCNANQSQVCNSTGTAWLTVEACAITCDNQSGLCAGACSPNEKRCNGGTPETCDASGSAWVAGQACSTYCYKGGCAEQGLTIDANANSTLDGEHAYAGDVTIINSSVLTVPSGGLIIRAKKFVLDASSQIIVTPTGNDQRGKGNNSTSISCSTGYCTATPTVGGSGGSHGTAAPLASASATCYYYNNPYTCSSSQAGGAVYAIADDEAAAGSPGGNCSGGTAGKGGGMLVIYADDVTIQGQITVNGQGGTGCAGGGSGGGVLVRATNNLTFTGSISTAGGSGGASGGGTGGNGVVKLLYGNAQTLTGSVVGAKFASYMPPGDLSSSTHPRSDRWYNDSFPGFDLAWSKPFTSSAGYYFKLNTTYGFIPTSSNAVYKPEESLLYTPADLAVGTNYFHIDTLGPFANMGTVEARFMVKINSTPPTITSSSHPSSSAWVTNGSPYFTWTLPQADVNTTNFYWEFDAFAATMPTTMSNKIPMDLNAPTNSKQILLPGKADGIWFLHLIAQDTMGYLTKAAAHYRVQIGNDPGKGSVSGTVTDSTNGSFVSGATITLNRGVHSLTTNANGGYALANTVFAQTYEIRASKTGYQDAVKTVTVVPGQTATVNFVLTP